MLTKAIGPLEFLFSLLSLFYPGEKKVSNKRNFYSSNLSAGFSMERKMRLESIAVVAALSAMLF